MRRKKISIPTKSKTHRFEPKKLLRRVLSTSAAVLGALGLGIAGTGGYEYYRTGEITHTETFLKSIPDRLTAVSEHLEALARQQLYLSGPEGGSVSSLDEIPQYQGESYVIVHNNIPEFTDEQKASPAYEFYSELDFLGRCGYAEAKITKELMPTEERGAIGSIKPSGWQTVKYDGIDGNYLYNRCHLIAYQLTAENANERNLITGTRYFNVEGMLPWENLVAQYIKESKDAVMYRVTPIFEGQNLVASGVQMEAESLGSSEICFNIFVFNIQPGIEIDYATGDSQIK